MPPPHTGPLPQPDPAGATVGDATSPAPEELATRAGDSAPADTAGFEDWMFGRGASDFAVTDAVPGWDILGELGRGGMGVVYKARQATLNRVVALKMILDGARSVGGARFLIEAEAVAAVRHPNVVQVYEFGEADGRPFLAMEYLGGGTLSGRLTAGRLDPVAAAELVGKLAAGVQAAHDAGIVHRDLKPGNVLFDDAGEPKVTDFGLAKRIGAADLTHTQAVMGTPAYMAPEQAEGNAKFAGPPADVYSLGVILYECLTGGVPFAGSDTWAVVRQVIEREPPTLRSRAPGVPRDLELICLKCLAKEPHRRYPTAAALADDLGRFLRHEPVGVRAASLGERAAKWARRNPTTARMIGLTALAAAVVLGVALWSRWEVRAAAEREALADVRAALADEQTRRADTERAAAERAAADREFLVQLTQARNRRLAGRPGWTWPTADELRRAARLPHAPDLDAALRDELVAALTAPDAKPVATWDLPEKTADDGHCVVAHPNRPLLAVTRFGFPNPFTLQLTVWLLDTTTGRLAATLDAPFEPAAMIAGGSKESPAGLAFSPDGKWLVMSSRSGALHRWDVSGPVPGAVVTEAAKGHGGPVAFSPDGRTLYARAGTTLRTWDTATWKEGITRELGSSAHSITHVTAADSLVVGVTDHVFFLDPYDLSDLCPFIQVPGAMNVAVAPDGRTGLVAERPGVTVFDLLSRRRAGTLDYRPAVGAGVPLPGLSPDGRFAVIAPSSFRGLILHDLASGRMVCEINTPERATSPPYAFSPDGGTLYVGDRNRIRAYELRGARPTAPSPYPLKRFGGSPDGRTLYTVANRNDPSAPRGVEVTASDATAGRHAPPITRFIPSDGADPSVAPFRQSDGPWLVFGTSVRGIAWDLSNDAAGSFALPPWFSDRQACFGPAGELWIGGEKAVAVSVPGFKPTGATYIDPLRGRFRGLGSATVLAGGRSGVLVANQDGELAWIDRAGRAVKKWTGGNTGPSFLGLSPDEQLALVGLESGEAAVFRLPTGERVAGWPAHGERITAACWLAPDQVVTASKDRALTLWRLGTESASKLFTVPTPLVIRDLAGIAGGKLAALGEEARGVAVVDLPALAKELDACGLGVGLPPAGDPPPDLVTPFWRKPRPTHGLRADYFAHPKDAPAEAVHVLTRIEADPGADTSNPAFHPAVPADWFRATYRGWLTAPQPGRYTLDIDADDEARVYLDGQPVGEKVYRGSGQIALTLTDKPHRLRIEYAEEFGTARLRVRWSGPNGFAGQPLGTALSPDRPSADAPPQGVPGK